MTILSNTNIIATLNTYKHVKKYNTEKNNHNNRLLQAKVDRFICSEFSVNIGLLIKTNPKLVNNIRRLRRIQYTV